MKLDFVICLVFLNYPKHSVLCLDVESIVWEFDNKLNLVEFWYDLSGNEFSIMYYYIMVGGIRGWDGVVVVNLWSNMVDFRLLTELDLDGLVEVFPFESRIRTLSWDSEIWVDSETGGGEKSWFSGLFFNVYCRWSTISFNSVALPRIMSMMWKR